jgi:hypothetical protein
MSTIGVPALKSDVQTPVLSNASGTEQFIYGSDRLGVHTSGILKYNSIADGQLNALPYIDNITLGNVRQVVYRCVNNKRYETKDHLGNVKATFSDLRKYTIGGIPPNFTFTAPQAEQKSMNNYYSFGSPTPNLYTGGILQATTENYETGDATESMSGYKYRYGFNGQEKDNEIAGVGNHNTALFWEYDTRLGRRWNLDPKPNASVSFYTTFENNPIRFSDVFGDTLGVNAVTSTKPYQTWLSDRIKHDKPKDIFELNKLFAHDNSLYNSTEVERKGMTENDGVFAFLGHGSKEGKVYFEDKNIQSYDAGIIRAEDFNTEMAKRCPEWAEAMASGKKITLILYACHVADDKDNNVAMNISKAFPNVTVMASNGTELSNSDGFIGFFKRGKNDKPDEETAAANVYTYRGGKIIGNVTSKIRR